MFSAANINPIFALYHYEGDADGWGRLQIFLKPFALQGEWVGEWVETSICLDSIEGVGADLCSVQGQSFFFPVNPVPGYIDGSIYICGRHHPVDVTKLAFGHMVDGGIALTLVGSCSVFGEGPMLDIALTLETTVRLPLTSKEIEQRLGDAIARLGFSGSKDVGKLMAHIKSELPYPSQLAHTAKIARRLLEASGR